MNKFSGKKEDNLNELLPIFGNAYSSHCSTSQLRDNDFRNNAKNVPMDCITFSIANGISSSLKMYRLMSSIEYCINEPIE